MTWTKEMIGPERTWGRECRKCPYFEHSSTRAFVGRRGGLEPMSSKTAYPGRSLSIPVPVPMPVPYCHPATLHLYPAPVAPCPCSPLSGFR